MVVPFGEVTMDFMLVIAFSKKKSCQWASNKYYASACNGVVYSLFPFTFSFEVTKPKEKE